MNDHHLIMCIPFVLLWRGIFITSEISYLLTHFYLSFRQSWMTHLTLRKHPKQYFISFFKLLLKIIVLNGKIQSPLVGQFLFLDMSLMIKYSCR